MPETGSGICVWNFLSR